MQALGPRPRPAATVTAAHCRKVTAEASAQRHRGKRARSVEASSLNPSNSASRKSSARKYLKGIPCLFDEIILEVMWGLQNLMHFLVPEEKMELRNEDRILMSQGLKMLLNRYGFDVKPEMVNAHIIMMACILVDCESCNEKHSKSLRMAGANLKDLSGIDTEDWDLLKLATALKIICYPAERSLPEAGMFTQDDVKTFVRDAHRYEGKIGKHICLNAYYDIVRAHKNSASVQKIMANMLPAYEGEQN